MASVDSLEQLLQEELKDLYDAEKQLTKALPKMAKKASAGELQDAFDEYISDPAHPVPFLGYTAQNVPQEYMVSDQRFAARRADVLVYETRPLEDDVTMVGAVSPATEDSVRRARSQRPEPLGDRLLLTESIFAALFVVAAIALIEIGNPGHVPVGPAIVLTIAFALLSRFEFEVGAGSFSGTGLVKGSGYPILTAVVDLVEVGAGGGSLGSAGSNQKVADQRAQAAKNYLVTRHGIDPNRITTEGQVTDRNSCVVVLTIPP